MNFGLCGYPAETSNRRTCLLCKRDANPFRARTKMQNAPSNQVISAEIFFTARLAAFSGRVASNIFVGLKMKPTQM
jgi:hypothetical protein